MSFFFVRRLKRGIQNLSNLHIVALTFLRSFCGAKHPEEKKRAVVVVVETKERGGTLGGGGGTRRKHLLSRRRRRHVAHVFWKKSHGTRERNLGIDRNERESILYSTVQRRTGAIHPGRSQGAPSRNALFTEKVRERRRKQRERKTKHISCDGNPPFFDFAKQESVDDLSQRTREKNPKFTMDVRRRFTRFYFRKPIAFRTRLFYEVFKDIEQIHGEERRN